MTLTFFGVPSHALQLKLWIPSAVLNPDYIAVFGLASFAFARHYSQNLVWFLFLALLRCFSSGGSPHIPILFSIWCIAFCYADCSIRKSAYQCLLTAPRSLSQLTTSFIGSQCQGILHTLLLALPFVSERIFVFVEFFTWLYKKTCFFIIVVLLLVVSNIFSIQFSRCFVKNTFSSILKIEQCLSPMN